MLKHFQKTLFITGLLLIMISMKAEAHVKQIYDIDNKTKAYAPSEYFGKIFNSNIIMEDRTKKLFVDILLEPQFSPRLRAQVLTLGLNASPLELSLNEVDFITARPEIFNQFWCEYIGPSVENYITCHITVLEKNFEHFKNISQKKFQIGTFNFTYGGVIQSIKMYAQRSDPQHPWRVNPKVALDLYLQ